MKITMKPIPNGREGLMDDAGYNEEIEKHDCNMCIHQKITYENGKVWAQCDNGCCEFEYIEEE